MRRHRWPVGCCILLGAVAGWAVPGCEKTNHTAVDPKEGGADASTAHDAQPGKPQPDAQSVAGALDPFIRQAGSRIKVRWYETPDGTRLAGSFYDTVLQVSCQFTTAADGETRCLPTGPDWTRDFADSDCTIDAVVLENANCQPAEYIWRSDYTDPCITRSRIYRRGEATTRVYRRVLTTGSTYECKAILIPPTSRSFLLGAEPPVSTFVKVAKVNPSGQTPPPLLDFMIGEAEDGTLLERGWKNTVTGTHCMTVRTSPDGELHCLPSYAPLSATARSDSACTQPAAYFNPACKAAPAYALQTEPKKCPEQERVLQMGPKLDRPYNKTETACGVTPVTSGYEYHSVLGPVSSEMFPLFPIQTVDGTQRLRRRLLGPPTGRRIVSYDLFDAVRNENCTGKEFAKGHARCAPRAASFENFYGDSACQEPLWRTPPDSCPPEYVSIDDLSVCPNRPQIYRVASTHTGLIYRRALEAVGTSVAEVCRVLQTKVPGESYAKLTAIPEETFPELTLREP